MIQKSSETVKLEKNRNILNLIAYNKLKTIIRQQEASHKQQPNLDDHQQVYKKIHLQSTMNNFKILNQKQMGNVLNLGELKRQFQVEKNKPRPIFDYSIYLK